MANTNIIETTTTTESTTNDKVTIITELGKLAQLTADGGNTKKVSAEAISALPATASYDELVALAASIYEAASVLAQVREAQGVEEDMDALKFHSSELRNLMRKWFMAFGTRPAAKFGGKRRPIYSVTDADMVILGEITAEVRRLSKGNLAKIPQMMFDRLFLQAGRTMNGQPFERVTAEQMSSAMALANEARAKKAAATKAENEKERKEEAVKEAAEKAELEELRANAINAVDIIAKMTEALAATSATQQEQADAIELLARLLNA